MGRMARYTKLNWLTSVPSPVVMVLLSQGSFGGKLPGFSCRGVLLYFHVILSMEVCMSDKQPQLKYDPHNARKHSQRNKAVIRQSLQEVGASACAG